IGSPADARHVRPCAGERDGCGLPDSRAGPGHERDAPLQRPGVALDRVPRRIGHLRDPFWMWRAGREVRGLRGRMFGRKISTPRAARQPPGVPRRRRVTIGESITLDDLETDPYPVYERLREDEPVAWVPAVELWLVTRFEDVQHVDQSPEVFTAETDPSTLDRKSVG